MIARLAATPPGCDTAGVRRLACLLLLAPGIARADDAPVATAPQWMATLGGGVLARDDYPAHAFATASLSRRIGQGYVRLAATTFESTLQQVDTVRPSTYYLGYLGAGWNFGRWFTDGYVALGRQDYGRVETGAGDRRPRADGSPVFGLGLSGGRYVPLGGRWSLSPSLAVRYGYDRVLRQDLGYFGPQDAETVERSLTGVGAIRLDRVFGAGGRSFAGISLARYQSSDGGAAAGAGPFAPAPGRARSSRTADGWSEIGAAGALALRPRLWLDLSASRTIGAATGDGTIASSGLRIAF